MEKPSILYICKGEGAKCYLYPYCIYRGDPAAAPDQVCSHIDNADLAKYGACKDPENHPERFRLHERPDDSGPSYYWEYEV